MDSRHDSRRSDSRIPARTTSLQRDWTAQLRQTPPPSSTLLTTVRTLQLNCASKKPYSSTVRAKSSTSSKRNVAASSERTQWANTHEPNSSRCRTDGPHLPARHDDSEPKFALTSEEDAQRTTAPSTAFPTLRQNLIEAPAKHPC